MLLSEPRNLRWWPCEIPGWIVHVCVVACVLATLVWLARRWIMAFHERTVSRQNKERDKKKSLHSGDVVFSCGSSFLSCAQRLLLNTPVSHVGVLLVEHDEEPWVLESRKTTGVVKTRLHSWIHANTSKGKNVFLRRAQTLMPDAERRRKMTDFATSTLGRPFSYRFWLPFLLPVSFASLLDDTNEAKFCSQLVVEALIVIGVLDTTTTHLVLPKDLFQFHDAFSRSNLQWKHGGALSAVETL